MTADPAPAIQVQGLIKAFGHQVALRFLLRHRGVWAIPKATQRPHVEDNAAADRLELTAEEIARIDAAFPCGPKPRALPMI